MRTATLSRHTAETRIDVTLDLDGPAAPQKGMHGGTVSGFSATGSLSRKDFNFGQKYTAPILGDDVKFTIDIEMDQP